MPKVVLRELVLTDWAAVHRLATGSASTGFTQPAIHADVGLARVLNELGMTFEGRHRHTVLDGDRWCDSDVFSLLEEDWNRAGSEPSNTPTTVAVPQVH